MLTFSTIFRGLFFKDKRSNFRLYEGIQSHGRVKTGNKIKISRSVNSTEYINEPFKKNLQICWNLSSEVDEQDFGENDHEYAVWWKRKIPHSFFFLFLNLRIFGTPMNVQIPKQKRKKWDKKSEEIIFVAYDSVTKGFRCTRRLTRLC